MRHLLRHAGNRVTNNQNLFTRLGYLFRTGDASRWTCADHANNLDFVFRGMGINDTFLVRADSRSGLPTPNSYHFCANRLATRAMQLARSRVLSRGNRLNTPFPKVQTFVVSSPDRQEEIAD